MNRRVLAIVALIAALLASPLLAHPADAADVPVTLIAFNTSWHVGTETAPADPTITVTAGDVLRLRVENHDAFQHTFTLPHFSVDLPLSAGSVIFVNITTTASDVGTWQFYCAVPGHAPGTDPNRTGMVGRVRVNAPAPAVDVTLIAFTTSWHVGSHSAPPKPTITVNPGEVLRLRVENHDAFPHTFTFPHFSVDVPLAAGSPTSPFVAFVNITTSTADNGRWQFYCAIPGHFTGTGENRDLMVGWVQVGTPTNPPPTPGFEVVLVIAALGAVAVAARVFPRRGK
jgi:uncharacterized cupredoxin-like copper-binding protein